MGGAGLVRLCMQSLTCEVEVGSPIEYVQGRSKGW